MLMEQSGSEANQGTKGGTLVSNSTHAVGIPWGPFDKTHC